MASGRLESINVSDGGVPKRPVPECRVGSDGLQGDRQRDLRYHGGPDRAVCLYPLELIESLRSEGHPIAVGTIGENFTVSGVDWSRLTPGAELSVGRVLLQVTAHAHPCRNIAGSFLDGGFGSVSEKQRPGWSRLYARVLRAGLVRVGDPVALGGAAGEEPGPGLG